jgi:hypothetical protein
MTMRGSERRERMKRAIAKAQATADAHRSAHNALPAEECNKWRCSHHDAEHKSGPCLKTQGCDVHNRPNILPPRTRRSRRPRFMGMGQRFGRSMRFSSGPARTPGR